MIDGRRGRTAKESAPDEQFESHPDDTSPAVRDHLHEQPDGERSPVRDRLRRLALGRRLARHGVSANHVTLAGLVVAAATGAVIALGHLWVGVALVTFGGLMDTLDGAVAKASGTSSRRGAFLDSVSDRVADAFMFGGLAWYLADRHTPELALLPFAILAVGNVISYERAKAESFGWEAKGGLMERAERLILLAVAMAFNVVLVPLLWVLLGLCVITALQRFVKVWRQATAEITGEPVHERPSARPATGAVIAAWRPARVESRWRAWREAQASGSSWRAPDTAHRSRSRRRTGEPLSTRLRSVLAADRSGSEHGGRTITKAPARRAQRRQEGAAAALRRRLGTGR
jgi:CDP-diacylglycerol--glycerol-3-phosphate 3-phosphatidyltransferase